MKVAVNPGQADFIPRKCTCFFPKGQLPLLYKMCIRDRKNVAMIQGLRLFASAQNLFTISAIKYMDPELRTDNATDAGMDGSAYPQMKNYTLGVNITF